MTTDVTTANCGTNDSISNRSNSLGVKNHENTTAHAHVVEHWMRERERGAERKRLLPPSRLAHVLHRCGDEAVHRLACPAAPFLSSPHPIRCAHMPSHRGCCCCWCWLRCARHPRFPAS